MQIVQAPYNSSGKLVISSTPKSRRLCFYAVEIETTEDILNAFSAAITELTASDADSLFPKDSSIEFNLKKQ